MSSVINNSALKALQGNQGKYDSWSLFFDKFSGYSTKKEPILKQVKTCYAERTSIKFIEAGILKKYTFFKSLEQTRQMRFIYLENSSRLLVNMGHSCVLENVGFSFERISGIPSIPGSALKGVVSNWALWDANGEATFEEGLPNFSKDRSKLPEELVDIFGANEGDAKQGKINFYGIFPLEVPELEIDILTPHQGGRIIPNNFLTVAAGTIWVIPIALNRGDTSLLDKAEELIEECLTNYGVGAKTASGYGKFETPVKTELDALIVSLDKKQITQQEIFSKADELAKEAQQEEAAKAKAETDEQNRIANLSPEDKAAEEFEETLSGNDLESKSGDLKGQMARINELPEVDQRSILLLLKGEYKHIWQNDLKEAKKAEDKVTNAKNEKKREKAKQKLEKNSSFKRVMSVKSVAKTLEVDL